MPMPAADTSPNALLPALLGAVWSSPRMMEDLNALCALGGRFSGTESEAAAREWLAEALAEVAGVPVRRESVAYRGWERGAGRVVLPDGRPFPVEALVRSPSTPPGGLTAPILDLGRATPEQIAAAGEAVRGAIILARHEFMFGTGHVHRRRKYDAARAAGAVGFLIANNDPGCLPVVGSSGDGLAGHIPAGGIPYETGAALAQVAASGSGPVTLHLAGRFVEDATSENLLATIPGESDEVVVLSAHIDGHCHQHAAGGQSAIDNASGLICALGVIRALRSIPGLRLKRGVEIGFFNIEEWALLGSEIHLDRMGEAERRRRVLNINLDSVAGDPHLTALTGGVPGLDAFLDAVLRPAGLQIGHYSPFMSNSDHANYVRQGIPAFRLVAGFDRPTSFIRHVLTPADTVDKVHPHEMKTAASIAGAVLLAACTDSVPVPPHMDAATVRRITG